jgi:hypothetical protein
MPAIRRLKCCASIVTSQYRQKRHPPHVISSGLASSAMQTAPTRFRTHQTPSESRSVSERFICSFDIDGCTNPHAFEFPLRTDGDLDGERDRENSLLFMALRVFDRRRARAHTTLIREDHTTSHVCCSIPSSYFVCCFKLAGNAYPATMQTLRSTTNTRTRNIYTHLDQEVALAQAHTTAAAITTYCSAASCTTCPPLPACRRAL